MINIPINPNSNRTYEITTIHDEYGGDIRITCNFKTCLDIQPKMLGVYINSEIVRFEPMALQSLLDNFELRISNAENG